MLEAVDMFTHLLSAADLHGGALCSVTDESVCFNLEENLGGLV